jgi:hypothetical protein
MTPSKLKITLSLLAASTVLALRAAADPINFGFETGDLSGWSVSTGDGGAAFANVVTFAVSGEEFDPVQGDFFADLYAGGGTGVYTTISQTFSLTSGETLSGEAAFLGHDYFPFDDDAFVSIVGETDPILFSADIDAVGDFGNTEWTEWSFTAPTAGSYTLTYGVENIGDNDLSSEAIFDAPAATPDATSTLILMNVGLLGLAGLKRKFRK